MDGFAKPKHQPLPVSDIKEINQKVLDFTISTFSPMKICEDPYFGQLAQKLVAIGASYGNIEIIDKLAKRKALRSMLDTEYESKVEKVIQIVQNADAVAFSSDIWSCSIGDFLDISFTSIKNFEMKNGQVVMFHMKEKHTGEQILKIFKSEFEKVNLETFEVMMVSDSGSNMLKAAKDGAMTHVRCICHRFNTVINEAWKVSQCNSTLHKLDIDISSLIEYVNRTNIQSKLPIKLQSGCKTRPWRALGDRTKTVLRSYDALLNELNACGQMTRIYK